MRSSIKNVVDDIDYLIPLITYLGSNPYWWARSSQSLANELSLNPKRVEDIFERNPTIFRKSPYDKDQKRYYYSLQMRYAQRSDGQTKELPNVSSFPVLSEEEIISLIDFLVRISSIESTMRANQRTNIIVIISALISSIAAVFAAVIAASIK